ncbi:hypothetical protein [Kaistella jeonii]|uniref:Lipoprotein n=1 Tax=Kaistella jeonii TaxID=266749 RepID=A0A0C1CX78_9FLAO|nr:hypothetical protein [Kaistella jeonii]KIA88991.1 hypothetical protein OA86_07885 [Kaistella jeonii]SFB97237.1 hypothetical protein SAMN05421876_104191 [Kaistella jeonii]VEI97216.1 Uncharacterised protein [Kaistella jeonii]
MKNLIFVFLLLILAGCKTQNKYSDFDYSYSRSGGFSPIYENLLIKGNNAHYSFEAQEKKVKKDFQISNEELKNIESVLTQNNFRSIQEDYKKIYDHISTSINVTNGANSGRKSNAASIMKKDNKRWEAVTNVFQQIISSNTKAVDSKK